MALKERSYWLDTVEMPVTDSSRALPEHADVVVIGAGLTGLSAARALAKRGVQVAVLEAESVGWGASSRNAGMVLAGLPLDTDELLRKYGRDTTMKLHAASLESIDYVEQIVREDNTDCDFHRSGHLELASKPSHFERLARLARVLEREFNYPVRLVPKDTLREEIASAVYYGGLVDEKSARVNPAQFIAGLARAAERSGAMLFEHTRVERVRSDYVKSPGNHLVFTSRGEIRAREVLVATSGYTSKATPALRKKIIPIDSHIAVTEPLTTDLVLEVLPRNRMVYDSKNFLHYFRLTPDRRMLFGGRIAFFPQTASSVRSSAEILRREMVRVFPQLRGTKVEYVWGGTTGCSFDMLPHAGQLQGLHYALGYGGHGVAMATYLGTKIAGIICGEREEIPFSQLPLPGAPLGLYGGTPWFLPLVGAWCKLMDWLD